MINIAHLGDLHTHWHFALEALNQNPPETIIALSGDLSNFEGKRSARMRADTQMALQEFASQAQTQHVHVAVCSGNHDYWVTPWNENPYWLRTKTGCWIGDTETRLLRVREEKVIISSIPWRDFEEPCALMHSTHGILIEELEEEEAAREKALATLQEGAGLKKKHPEALWIWLHHNPPSFSQLSGRQEASNLLIDWTLQHQPDLVLCGHIHTPAQPFERFEQTLTSNPGRGAQTVGLNQIRAVRRGDRWKLDGIHDRL